MKIACLGFSTSFGSRFSRMRFTRAFWGFLYRVSGVGTEGYIVRCILRVPSTGEISSLLRRGGGLGDLP
jgi:hypothetical protein